jgi:hypothetical protein
MKKRKLQTKIPGFRCFADSSLELFS